MGKQTPYDHSPTEPAGPAGPTTAPAAAPATGPTWAGERR